jgi:hypothetical protein
LVYGQRCLHFFFFALAEDITSSPLDMPRVFRSGFVMNGR